ncbi:MAG: M67 family metallopeptidase [Pontixanthobacter sp.]
MELTQAILDQLLAHAKRAHPDECCGILFGQGEEIASATAVTNVHPAPQTHFEIDPAALIIAYKAERDGGPRIMGFYHSHPNGPPAPSATDSATAAGDGKIWAIVGDGEIKFWRDTSCGFEPLSQMTVTA